MRFWVRLNNEVKKCQALKAEFKILIANIKLGHFTALDGTLSECGQSNTNQPRDTPHVNDATVLL